MLKKCMKPLFMLSAAAVLAFSLSGCAPGAWGYHYHYHYHYHYYHWHRTVRN